MKTIKTLAVNVKTVVALLLLAMVQTVAWAQDGGADVDVKITTESENWYTQPWVWIVGAAVFILLLVALLRGNKSNA